ncbi:MAG: hypothetical protein EOP94_01875, partial [Zymomonas sp.]
MKKKILIGVPARRFILATLCASMCIAYKASDKGGLPGRAELHPLTFRHLKRRPVALSMRQDFIRPRLVLITTLLPDG